MLHVFIGKHLNVYDDLRMIMTMRTVTFENGHCWWRLHRAHTGSSLSILRSVSFKVAPFWRNYQCIIAILYSCPHNALAASPRHLAHGRVVCSTFDCVDLWPALAR